MTTSMQRYPTLQVDIVGTANSRIPVSIADTSLLTIRTLMSGETVSLRPGRYVVSADLPGVGRIGRVVDILENDQSVTLKAPVDRREKPPARPSNIVLAVAAILLTLVAISATAVSSPVGVSPPPFWVVFGATFVLFAAVVLIFVALNFALRRIRPAAPDRRRTQRTVDGLVYATASTRSRPALALRGRSPWATPLVRTSTDWDGVSHHESVGVQLRLADYTTNRASIVCRVTGPATVVAEFAIQGLTPVTVVLPAWHWSRSDTCTVTLGASGGDLRATLSFGSPDLAALAAYVEAGDIRGATVIASDAKGRSRDRHPDPVFAALCAYVLLRRNEAKPLGFWTAQLAKAGDGPPDGAVIAGEQWARRGKHDMAVREFLIAMDRGLPIFADGFSLLASRLRRYLLYEPNELPYDRAFRGCLRDAEARYLALAPRVSPTSAVLTMRGAGVDSAHANEADQKPHDGTDGWQRVSHGAASHRTEQDLGGEER